ncbi:helix-hairpin-helix domain-containing protein [Bacillus paralicheniformis]|uniref:helix-hairpin-helix domain-containing protein n=1 Tax=Bacillus paralicheniformis TaxID=1648923 RepID=UPI00128BB3BD|nr:helix-hairpin-helix domain-containing protein [Bacillus paralicheniformis]MPQ26771.1 Pathogenicity locus [Bacillus paralicheniformis]
MKLPLTKKERSNLRTAKVKIKNTAYMDLSVLAHALGSSLKRAAYIKALAQFQTVPSIGPKMAQCAVDLGYYSLDDIKHESGADLIIRLEKLKGYWEDPCAEDALRCIVHYANDPESGKSWWDFTAERKIYRERCGYPPDRPSTPWYEKKRP